MATFAESEVTRLIADIGYTQDSIEVFTKRLENTQLTPLQRAAAQTSLATATAKLAKEKAELVAAQALVAQQGAGVLPTPARTAGQTVNDDNTPNPVRVPSLEVDPATGRVRPITTGVAASNADITPTIATGDVDINTNGPVKSFFTTQATTGASDEQGGSPIVVPPSIQYPSTDAAFGPARDGFTSSLPGFAGARAPTGTGIGSTDDQVPPSPSSTATEINNSYNDAAPIQPQPNALDQFGSYTYSASVYLMTPDQYSIFIKSKKRTVLGYNLLFQSAGAPGSSGGASGPNTTNTGPANVSTVGPRDPGGAGRNPYFDLDFYIDSITLETLFPGKLPQAAHSAATLKFTVIEPNGITLIDRLYKAVQDHVPRNGAGAINYTAVQYLLAIRWYGWDNNGKLIKNVGGGEQLSDPNAAIEKFIPFTIAQINWGVSNKLVTYDFVCKPVGQTVGSTTSRGTIPYDVELSDQTVKGLLSADAQYNQPANDGSQTSVVQTTSTPAPSKANAAPSSKKTIRQGLMGAMNDFQQQLVQDGIYEYADQYEIVFANGAEAIADALITKPENVVKNLSASPMAPPPTKDTSGLDPAKTSVDNTVRNFAVTAGQQLVQVIDLAIRNSNFISNQARIVNQEEPEIFTDEFGNIVEVPTGKPAVAKISWYNISMEATPLKYDTKRNDYTYKVTYIISPYVVQNFDSKYFPIPAFNGLHKSYKYWFTGENIGVLDYQVSFNHMYNQTVSGTEPGNSATDAIRRQRSSSMRDIPKYVYQARSTESSAGAELRGNEISANAAEYLYSPRDLAEAKLRIVGDPGWIMQGSIGAGVSSTNFNYQGFLPDGTINFDSQQVLFEIAWQRPVDYSLNTGLADPYALQNGNREPIQSNVYSAKKCISEFRQGKFEQTIEGALYAFPIPNGQNTPATKPANVNVASTGATPRAEATQPSSTADLAITGAGPIYAPQPTDTVQLTGTELNLPTQTSETLIRQENSPPDSNGSVVEVFVPGAPPLINASNDPTSDPNMIILGST
jgi:hypothetical protein